MPSVQGVTEGRLRTSKPFIHAVVALPPVVAVQMSIARGQSPLICRPVPPAWLPDAGTRGLQARTRGGVGGVKSLAVVNRKPTASLFFCVRRFRGWGYPPVMGPSRTFSHTGRNERENALVTSFSNYLTHWFTAPKQRVTIGRHYQNGGAAWPARPTIHGPQSREPGGTRRCEICPQFHF